ncbi:MAG: hydrogenase-4 component E [Alphaproteobacteria bacterium]|nr:hydrogenase-4 component E [Alphaproteobacteria bacterium]MBF0129663.1 hydrogenase-4 component E [Alphaproteobacteria bacterium]
MSTLGYDIAHLLDGAVLLFSFMLLYQRRMSGLISVFALQSVTLAVVAAWGAYTRHAPHLYASAAIVVVVKAVLIPVALHKIMTRLGIHRTVDAAMSIGSSMIAGASLVALSIMLVLPVTFASAALTRESLALALSTVLLGLLMMITRRNAVTQVIGFMSLENGLILAAVGVEGMPLVVEMSIAFSVMVAFIIFGIFFFQIRERFDSLDLPYLESFRGERR